jgi:hypothetical protein
MRKLPPQFAEGLAARRGTNRLALDSPKLRRKLRNATARSAGRRSVNAARAAIFNK